MSLVPPNFTDVVTDRVVVLRPTMLEEDAVEVGRGELFGKDCKKRYPDQIVANNVHSKHLLVKRHGMFQWTVMKHPEAVFRSTKGSAGTGVNRSADELERAKKAHRTTTGNPAYLLKAGAASRDAVEIRHGKLHEIGIGDRLFLGEETERCQFTVAAVTALPSSPGSCDAKPVAASSPGLTACPAQPLRHSTAVTSSPRLLLPSSPLADSPSKKRRAVVIPDDIRSGPTAVS